MCRFHSYEQKNMDHLRLAVDLSGEINTRSLANFPMQANGAEMMRIAMIQMVKEGIEVCAPVHDAFLIEAPLEKLEKSVHKAQEIMA